MKRPNLFVLFAHLAVFGILMGSMVNFGFIIDQWLSPVFGYGAGFGIFIAVISGTFLGLGAYGLFIHSERALKTILRLPDWERNIRLGGLALLNLLFIGMGILGLYFRLTFMQARGAEYLIWIGIGLEVCPLLFGLVLHPLQNPDIALVEEERTNRLGVKTINEVFDKAEQQAAARRYNALFGIDGEEDGIAGLLGESASTLQQRRVPIRTVLADRFNSRRAPKNSVADPITEEPNF